MGNVIFTVSDKSRRCFLEIVTKGGLAAVDKKQGTM
jgi:hypothetical protein